MNYQDLFTSGNEQLQATAWEIQRFRSMCTTGMGAQVRDS